MLRLLTIFGAGVLIGCAANPRPHEPVYETTYDCSVSETRGAVTLLAEPDHVGWIEDFDGVRIQAHVNFPDEAARKAFLQTGFANSPFNHPILFFDYPDDLKPDESSGYTIKGQPLANFFGGARAGDKFVSQPVSSNVFLTLNWKQVQALDHGRGMFVSLYDRSGTAHKTLHIPRMHFSDIENALKAMYAQVLDKEADREHLCKGDTHAVPEPIILIH